MQGVSLSVCIHTLSISLQKDLLHVTFVKSEEKKGAIGVVFTLLSRNTSEKVRTTACSRQASQMWRTDVRLHLYFFSFNISPDELLCSINYTKPRHVQFNPNTYHRYVFALSTKYLSQIIVWLVSCKFQSPFQRGDGQETNNSHGKLLQTNRYHGKSCTGLHPWFDFFPMVICIIMLLPPEQ